MTAQPWEPVASHEGAGGYERVRAVFEASYRRLVGQLYGVCGDLTEAEEVVAEAFSRAVQHQRTFARLDNPEAWLRTVAVNVSRTRFRRGLRIALREPAEARHPAMDDERLALMAAMRRLPAAQREAIALHYIADLPIHEVAEATGSPVGTVKARLSRGRAALAVLLADLPDSSEEARRG
jgi:RNA polymerase sigma-70 factor, ECF subfamily